MTTISKEDVLSVMENASIPVINPQVILSEKRRKPGRPTKKIEGPEIEVAGIISSPDDDNNQIELIYNRPIDFKQLFTFFKSIKAQTLFLHFMRDRFRIFVYDATKNNRFVVEFDCNKLNSYYCNTQDTLILVLNYENVEKIFNSIDKNCYKMCIIYQRDDDRLSISFIDNEMGKKCSYKVNLSFYELNPELYAALDYLNPDLYPLSFQLTTKSFKQTIQKVQPYSDNLVIIKLGDNHLNISFSELTVCFVETYSDRDRIHLISNIESTQLFKCRVKISRLTSLANAMITDSVQLYCREKDSILAKFKYNVITINAIIPVYDIQN